MGENEGRVDRSGGEDGFVSGAKREETWPLTPAYHKPAWKEQTNERPGVRSSFSTFLLATCYRVLYNKALLMVTDLEADAGI